MRVHRWRDCAHRPCLQLDFVRIERRCPGVRGVQQPAATRVGGAVFEVAAADQRGVPGGLVGGEMGHQSRVAAGCPIAVDDQWVFPPLQARRSPRERRRGGPCTPRAARRLLVLRACFARWRRRAGAPAARGVPARYVADVRVDVVVMASPADLLNAPAALCRGSFGGLVGAQRRASSGAGRRQMAAAQWPEPP